MAGEHPDRFEIAARNWQAQTRIIEQAHELTRLGNLSPELVEAIEDAYREQDGEAWDLALARFFEALAEATGENRA